MKRILVGIAAAALLFVGASAAFAVSPHWVSGPSVSTSGNSLTVAGSAAGLGNTVATADFTLKGTVDVFSRCYNRGGNKPQADNKQETISVDQNGSFDIRQGRTNVSFTISPLSTLTCPGNQVVKIESVSYDLWLRSATFLTLDTHLVSP